MKRYHRVLDGSTGVGALLSLAVVGCSGVDSPTDYEAVGTTEEAIIAGVDAKGASLNAVGSLVEIYRERACDDASPCDNAGSSGNEMVSRSTSSSPSTLAPATASGTVNPPSGQLVRPRPDFAACGSGGVRGATGIGGQSSAVAMPNAAGSGSVETVHYWAFCTGTLIGETAVLTAKHCLLDLDSTADTELGFAIGPDASNPIAVYPIVDYDWESEVPEDPNLLLATKGSDVGVAHLGVPVREVTPMRIGTLSDADVGRRFTGVGYGAQNNSVEHGTRKAGSVTLRGLGGNFADYAFGGLEGFLKAAEEMPYFRGYPDEYLAGSYNKLGLLPEYQAFFGGKSGDAQPCNGDSGGPIIAFGNRVRTVFGNITNGFASNKLTCDFGIVGAIFGPLTKAYIEESLHWVDQCEGTTVQGRCEGDLAIRCTNRFEGRRRTTSTDCGLLGLTCDRDPSGTVACVDPP